MTAETFTAVVRPSSTWSTEKKKGGSYKLDATAVAALGVVSTADDISLVLDILSACAERAHVVTPTSIGKASHVDAT